MKKIITAIAVVLAVALIVLGWSRSASAADPIPRDPMTHVAIQKFIKVQKHCHRKHPHMNINACIRKHQLHHGHDHHKN